MNHDIVTKDILRRYISPLIYNFARQHALQVLIPKIFIGLILKFCM